MPIAHLPPAAVKEEVLNAALAPLLQQAHPGIRARPEVRDRISNRIPDIRVHLIGRRVGGSSSFWRIIECKIDTRSPQKKAAAAQALEWINDGNCEAALACCYPKDLAAADDPRQALETTTQLQYAICRKGETEPQWHTGTVADLAHACAEAPVTGGAKITQLLGTAIQEWHRGLHATQRKDLAKALQTYQDHKDPKKREATIANGTAIAGLLLANMAMLHQQLASPSHRHISKHQIRSLGDLLSDYEANRTGLIPALQQQWQYIADIDYDPIVSPALKLLRQIRHAENEVPVSILMRAAENAVPLLVRDQLDYVGQIYHNLLESRYDGSFYTSTPAAILLAELAIPTDWVPDWSDWRTIADKRICDPACGTGTLLMAAQHVLLNRFRRKNHHPGHTDQQQAGIQQQERRLQRQLIEHGLIGMDINPHAIHLAACSLTLAAHNQEYNSMGLHHMVHGNMGDRTRAGSLELLIDTAQELIDLGLTAPGAQQGPHGAQTKDARTIAPPGSMDLVIMNPPYTRNQIRNDHLGADDERDVQQRELYIARKADAKYHDCIDNSAVRTYFTPIADRILKKSNGIYASVVPYTFNTGSSGIAERKLLQQQYHIQYVITGHDNTNLAFSGNTSIHESLIIARRRNTAGRGGGGGAAPHITSR